MQAQHLSLLLPGTPPDCSRSIFACVVMYTVLFLWPFTAMAQTDAMHNAAYLSQFEKELVHEMNIARRNPKLYVAFLEHMKPYFVGNLFKPPSVTPVVTAEGIIAVEEAIRFLHSVRPAPPLSPSRGMSLGARQHLKDQGPRGTTGHQGSDGSRVVDRVNRNGTWQRTVGENIAYGNDTTREVVLSFIIDDGVASRGHRQNLFNPEFHRVGVACGAHAKYGSACVITLAGSYVEKPQQK